MKCPHCDKPTGDNPTDLVGHLLHQTLYQGPARRLILRRMAVVLFDDLGLTMPEAITACRMFIQDVRSVEVPALSLKTARRLADQETDDQAQAARTLAGESRPNAD